MQKPEIKQETMHQLLRGGKIEEFNSRRGAGEACDLVNADLRGLDLRCMDAKGLDMSNTFLRQTDLRGLDLSQTLLEGASISGAKISGTYFPKGLSPEELTLSLVHGTRLRYR